LMMLITFLGTSVANINLRINDISTYC